MIQLFSCGLPKKKILGAAKKAVRPPELSKRPLLLKHDETHLPPFSFNPPVNMFKPSNPMMARLRFTTKQVNGGFYKGNRTGSMGHFDKKGNYVIDWHKVRTYVAPDDLDDFKVGELD